MPAGKHTSPSGSKPENPEGETCGFIFDGLTKEEIEDRLAFYSLPGIPDPSGGLDKILADDRRPLPAEEKVFDLIVPMLQGMLRAECTKPGDAKGNRQAIADLADSIVEKLLDAARGCGTRGQQHARILHRHPFAFSDACALSNDSPITVNQAKNRMHPLREFEVVREIEKLGLEFKKTLLSKPEREKRRDELFTKLKEVYPELEEFLQYPADITDLTPDRAARLVWGARQSPPISEKRVSNRLADLRDRIQFRTNIAAWMKKHPELRSTPREHEHS